MFHPNRSTYKYMVVNKTTGDVKKYLNAREVVDEYRISRATLYRCMDDIPSLKYDKQYKFIRCFIKVNDDDL